MSDMLTVKCALSHVVVAKYFLIYIPVIKETGGEEGGVLRGSEQRTTDPNELNACGAAF